ncbi:hypothetical protein BKA83DRAFT_4124270 [Pisolithus microcarpus]|nr:hypothetical protein BKA83DRAFT_4124270 [Pisolithus microcarpus]
MPHDFINCLNLKWKRDPARFIITNKELSHGLTYASGVVKLFPLTLCSESSRFEVFTRGLPFVELNVVQTNVGVRLVSSDETPWYFTRLAGTSHSSPPEGNFRDNTILEFSRDNTGKTFAVRLPRVIHSNHRSTYSTGEPPYLSDDRLVVITLNTELGVHRDTPATLYLGGNPSTATLGLLWTLTALPSSAFKRSATLHLPCMRISISFTPRLGPRVPSAPRKMFGWSAHQTMDNGATLHSINKPSGPLLAIHSGVFINLADHDGAASLCPGFHESTAVRQKGACPYGQSSNWILEGSCRYPHHKWLALVILRWSISRFEDQPTKKGLSSRTPYADKSAIFGGG